MIDLDNLVNEMARAMSPRAWRLTDKGELSRNVGDIIDRKSSTTAARAALVPAVDACAKVAEQYGSLISNVGMEEAAFDVADLIRQIAKDAGNG